LANTQAPQPNRPAAVGNTTTSPTPAARLPELERGPTPRNWQALHVDAGAARVWPSLRGRVTWLLLAPTLLLVFSTYWFARTDPDYWWHVRTGQYIVETGTLPRADFYSYTVNGTPWVTHEWLTELFLYLVQEQFGYAANVALFGLVGALTAMAVYATCRAWGLGEPAAIVLTLWAVVMGMGSANVRPQTLTALLLAICVLLLTRYKRGEARVLWALPPLMALWVNLHGGYVIGLVLMGLAVVGQALSRAIGRPTAPLRPLVLTMALSTRSLITG
jgi:hypothetical protein